jgi:hypothetical protein
MVRDLQHSNRSDLSEDWLRGAPLKYPQAGEREKQWMVLLDDDGPIIRRDDPTLEPLPWRPFQQSIGRAKYPLLLRGCFATATEQNELLQHRSGVRRYYRQLINL